MNKKILLRSFLILFPVLAVGLATTSDSVTVFDTLTGQMQHYSYFDLAPVANMQILPPLAACLSGLSGMLAAVYLARKQEKFLKASGYAAMASAVLAAIPAAIRGSTLLLPNVALPIFMLAQYGVARYLSKPGQSEERRENSKRLSKH